jgi:hypothetical protein
MSKRVVDETTHLLKSPANAARLLRSIADADAGKLKSKPPKPKPLPEWLLQSYFVNELRKLEADGWPISTVGDMNAGRRSYATASQAKAMGLTPGEPDVRIYGHHGRLLLVEIKVKGRKGLSDAQRERHARLKALGHRVVVVTLADEGDARFEARCCAKAALERDEP